MATTRPTRVRHAEQPRSLYADSSSGDDTEREEAPKSSRAATGSRKRLSDVHSKSHDEGSLTRNKTVNINDDIAEKRKRRQSTRSGENLASGPGRDGDGDDAPRAAHARPLQQLASVVQPTPVNLSTNNFEEWMKMAMDGKINAGNSWSLALIDYFHDMSLLRNNNDNSINFQKASSTLDGCVKIWTSRVDSVGTETGKLLSNLASGGRGDDDDEPASDNPDNQDPSQKTKRKAHRHESTLVKNRSQLKVKKLDLEFSVDPLFRKTCEDFDEGGAHGLLQNHLNLGEGSEGALRVIFDASDSMGKGQEDDEYEEPLSYIDLSELRSHVPELEFVEDKGLAPSLEGFSFQKSAFGSDFPLFREDISQAVFGVDDDDDDDNDGSPAIGDDFNMSVDVVPPPEEDFFIGDQAIGEFDGSPAAFDGEDGEEGSVGARADHGQTTAPGGVSPFDPRRIPNERELVMAMTGNEANGGMMHYFDQTFKKNWAGPEHWKLRKVVRRPDAAEQTMTKARREKKEPFKIDFSTPTAKEAKTRSKELFAAATRGMSLVLPKAASISNRRGARSKKGKEKRDEHILPDDMHFSSRQLVTLFLKPKFSLKMRSQRIAEVTADGDVDENFWAQAAAEQANIRTGNEDGDGEVTIPFSTQFLNDDDDDGPGFDDGFDGDIGDIPPSVDSGEQDLLAETQGQQRRVRPTTVNYTKKAKRVDVRKLKENIWRGLNITVPSKNEDDETMDPDDDYESGTDPKEARVFDTVLQGLENQYPADKLSEISTSFCFICLLHLANERGLKIEPGGDNAVDEGQIIGNIWDLKVYRDPSAMAA